MWGGSRGARGRFACAHGEYTEPALRVFRGLLALVGADLS